MERVSQKPLPMPDFHRRASAYQSSTSALGEYARAIEDAFAAGDTRVLFQIHDELAELEEDLGKLTGRALIRVDQLLQEK